MDLDLANPHHLRRAISTLRSALLRATHQFEAYAAVDARHDALMAELLSAASAQLHADIARIGGRRQRALEHARESLVAVFAGTIKELGDQADRSVPLAADLVPRSSGHHS